MTTSWVAMSRPHCCTDHPPLFCRL